MGLALCGHDNETLGLRREEGWKGLGRSISKRFLHRGISTLVKCLRNKNNSFFWDLGKVKLPFS
jgi:hypothetical protein